MPVFRKYEGSNWTIRIYPHNKIRRLVRFLPYLYGSHVSVMMVIKGRTQWKGISETQYNWQLFRWDVNSKEFARSGSGEFQILPKGKVKKRLDIDYLSIPGQYILEMGFQETIDGKENSGRFEEVATFTILDRDLFSAQWLSIIAGGAIGAVIGSGLTLLVTFLLGKG